MASSNPTVAILGSVATAIADVDGAGTVHRRLTQVRTMPEFLEKLVTENGDGDQVMQGWIIEPASPTVATDMVGIGGAPEVQHEMGVRVTGFCAVREAPPEGEEDGIYSHDDFLTTAWAVKLALDEAAIDMTGVTVADDWVRLPGYCQWRNWEMRLFGNVACWVASMTLSVRYEGPGATLGS